MNEQLEEPEQSVITTQKPKQQDINRHFVTSL